MTYKAGIVGTGGIAGMVGLHDADKIGLEKFLTSHAGGYHGANNIELIADGDHVRIEIEGVGMLEHDIQEP